MNFNLAEYKSLSKRYKVLLVTLVFPLLIFGQFRSVYMDSDSNNSLQKLHFLTPSTGYAAFRKYVGYTQDSGHSFTRKYITPDKVNFNGYTPGFIFGFWINGVYAINDAAIFVYGSYGFGSAILYSNDKGNTFKLIYYYDQQFSLDNPGVNRMDFPQGGAAGYAIEFNSILKSTDNGLSWTRIYYSPDADYSDIVFFNSSQGYVINDRVLQKTTDGGITWTTIAIPGVSIMSMSFLDFQRGYVAGDNNIYFTENGGQTWQMKNDATLYPSPGSIKFVSPAKGYGIGNRYTTYLTTDSGRIWEPLPRDNNFTFLEYSHFDIQFYNANQIWAGGGYGFLELTTNGGGIPMPVSRFKVDFSQINSVNKINLINYSGLNAEYEWYLNSVLISVAYNTSYQTSRASIDTIKLVVKRNGFSDSSVQIIDTRNNPKPCSGAFTAQLDTGTVLLKPSYHEIGVLHKWSFGDGTSDTVSVQPIHTYKSVGFYKVIHKALNTISKCVVIDSTIIQVIRTQNCLVPRFTFAADSFYTNIIKFQADWDKTKESDSGPVSLVTWTWGDSSQQDGDMIHYHEYEKNGNYRVVVSLKNYWTGCTASSVFQIVPVVMDTICNAAFDIRTLTNFYGFYYGYRAVVFNGKPLAIKEGKRHTYLANNTVISDGSNPNTSYDFFTPTSGDFFNVSGNDCGFSASALNIDSINKVIKHIVFDSIKGCTDTVSRPFTVPRVKNVFIKPVPRSDFPAYVTFEFYEKLPDGSTMPYYSRNAIDNLYSGGYTFANYDNYKSFLFKDSGIHRIAIASNRCTFNEREVYYIYYKPTLPECLIFPTDFSFSQVQNNIFQFYNLSNNQNSQLNNSFVWYFGDGDSSLIVNPQHTYSVPGTYQVKLFYKNSGGCTKQTIKTITVSGTVTSVNSNSGANIGLRLSPNPVHDYLFVDGFSGIDRWMNLEVHNLNGQKIISQSLFTGIRSVGINVERLVPGFYILTLRRRNGMPVFLNFTKQ